MIAFLIAVPLAFAAGVVLEYKMNLLSKLLSK